MKFRKKPVVIDAWQWNNQPSRHWPEWLACDPQDRITLSGLGFCIHTMEGVMIAEIGDWIIKGIKGELYPCKPDIFEATYERVEEHPTEREGA